MPTLGICLGEQLVAISQGAVTYKLKYGHRGQNKPVVDLLSGRGYVTSENHGYSVDAQSLSKTELKPWFVNADDKTSKAWSTRPSRAYPSSSIPRPRQVPTTPSSSSTGSPFAHGGERWKVREFEP